MYNVTYVVFAVLTIALVDFSSVLAQESGGTKPPDYLISAFSGGVATADLPRTRLLEDRSNQSILRACLDGANLKELTKLGIDSLEERVDKMCNGNVLKCEDSIFRPMLPVFAGAKHEQLDSIADMYASQLADPVRLLLKEIRLCGDVKPDEHFHLLWSLIIDQCWYSIWRQLKPTETGPPQVCWIVDPTHEYLVGTNFWQLPGGSFVAATWSPNSSEYIELLEPLSLELLRAAWNMPVNDSAKEALLRRYGFLADDEAYLGLIYRDSTSFVSQQEKWRDRYSGEVAGSLDLKTAATALALPEGQTFVILLHEIAYALFKQLADSHDLEYPRLLRTGRPIDQTVDLVSVRLVRRPLPGDEVMALLMENNYHGTDEIVRLIRETIRTNLDNIEMRLFLGMSLYDLERYDEAIVEFQELSTRTVAHLETKRLYDWSRVWLGHVYDARGDRVKALKWYKAVVDDGSPDSKMSFGQYRIGSIDAVTWAKERIITPFSWH